MCVGLPILGAVAAIGQGIMGYMGAQAEYQAREDQYAANLTNAKTAMNDRTDAIQSRVLQEKAAASQQIQEAQIKGLQSRSQMRLAAAESGVSGVTVDAMMSDVLAQEARYISNTKTNFDYSRDYWIGEGKATAAQAQSQVNSVQRMAKPSFLPYAISAFGQALQGVG
jgi:hypothetical protein